MRIKKNWMEKLMIQLKAAKEAVVKGKNLDKNFSKKNFLIKE